MSVFYCTWKVNKRSQLDKWPWHDNDTKDAQTERLSAYSLYSWEQKLDSEYYEIIYFNYISICITGALSNLHNQFTIKSCDITFTASTLLWVIVTTAFHVIVTTPCFVTYLYRPSCWGAAGRWRRAHHRGSRGRRWAGRGRARGGAEEAAAWLGALGDRISAAALASVAVGREK